MSEKTNIEKNAATEERIYKVTVGLSKKELTAREKIAMKNFGSFALSLDRFLDEQENGEITIPVDNITCLGVDNLKAENPHYQVYVITSGDKHYYTSSKSLKNALDDIIDELADAQDTDPWSVRIFKKDSNNYKGKKFITCTLV